MDLPDARVRAQSSITTLLFFNVEVASSSNMIVQGIDRSLSSKRKHEHRLSADFAFSAAGRNARGPRVRQVTNINSNLKIFRHKVGFSTSAAYSSFMDV